MGILGDYCDKIDYIKNHVKGFWNERSEGFFTLHDETHCMGVECALYKLIPIHKKMIPLNASFSGRTPFSSEQWFYLIAAAWLHDVGMAPNILKNDEIKTKSLGSLKDARKKHHERSSQYVRENSKILKLNETEKNNISQLCKYHRRSVDIKLCPAGSTGSNLPLLAAYLRMADAIHINFERVDEKRFDLFELIGWPEESKFHWMKSKLIEDVIPDPEKLTITINFRFSEDDIKDSVIIVNMIKAEIESELFTVRNILIRGGISYYLDIETSNTGIPADEDLKLLLNQMIDSRQLDSWASATDVANCLINTVIYLNEMPDKEMALNILNEYKNQVIKGNLEKRTCHTIIEKVYNIINSNIKSSDETDFDERFNNIYSELIKIKTDRERAIKIIAKDSEAILSDCESILLFGHSKIVLKALQNISKRRKIGKEVKRKTNIFVCEGRNSGRYSYSNELEYCDGLEYARSIKELGFENVNLVPDILIGNLLSREENGIKKIILGANGIDIDDSSFGHTAGHLTITELARIHEVPVYVLADSFKFGKLNYNEKIQRDTDWFMGAGSINYYKLKGIDLFNPREDKVAPENVNFLITDKGTFPPRKIPSSIKKEFNIYRDKYCYDGKKSKSKKLRSI